MLTTENWPKGGTVVIVGVWFGTGEWIRACNPERIILVYNTVSPDQFMSTYRGINRRGFYDIEVVCASETVLRSVEGLEGIVEPSLIDIERFRPATNRPDRPFTVGRVSRDVPEKHHETDPQLYRDLVAEGCRVRIMGGTCLSSSLENLPGVELLPALAEPAEQFLQTLDCFYFRTADSWVEAFGRVIIEAMASGLAVVAHRIGGYSEEIEHGRNGFLFDTKDEALSQILRLKDNAKLLREVGPAARESAEQRYSIEARAQIREFYLRTP